MQHDYNLINQSGADFRADLNNALSAIATVNSGSTEPSTTFAHQLWVDTSNNVLKIRNAANSAFITTGVSITADNTFNGTLTGSFVGNATTATTLATARTINGVSFNGSANISFNTDSVAEGSSNLYYTDARFDTRLASKSTTNLSEGSNLYFTNERVDDRVAALIQDGTGISFTYDDTNATLTPVITLSPFNTSQLSESGNLYYTDARARAAISENSAQLSYNSGTGVLTYTQGDTDTVSEGSNNLYYTSARANADFDTRLATKSTSSLAEGTNLYYTTTRFDSAFTSKDTDSLSEGTNNLYYTQSRFDSAFGNKTTANLTENTNLYFTDTRANAAIDARVVKSFVDALGIQAASVADNSVVLGNDTTGNYIQTITGTSNKITVSGSGSESADVTLTLPDDVQIADSLTVAGNLVVNGTLVSLDSTNLDITDNLFQLNAGLTGSPVNDTGMLINRGNQDNGIFMWDESVDKFTLGLTTADGSATGNITLSALGTLVANLEGNVTGQVSDLSNFTTANLNENTNLYYTDARVQAVSINNVVEDTSPQLGGDLDLNSSDITGTGDINITGTITSSGNITGTLATVAQPNITSVGTLTALTGGTGDLNWDSGTLFVDSSANAVGIGTDNPSDKVQILDSGNLALRVESSGASNQSAVWTENNAGSINGMFVYGSSHSTYGAIGAGEGAFYSNTNINIMSDSASGVIKFSTGSSGGTERLRINSTGIDVTGTATMDGLNVSGNSSSRNTIVSNVTLDGGTTVANPYEGFGFGVDFIGRDYGNAVRNYASIYTLMESKSSSSGGGDAGLKTGLSFYTNSGGASGTNPTEKLRISSSGKIGIGTTATDGMLTIKKTGSNIFGDSAITIQSADTNQSTLALGLTGSVAYIDSTESGSGTVLPLVFATGSTERMRVTSTGVGIGITPSNTFSVGASGTVTTRYTSTDTSAFSLLQFENSGSIVLSADHGNSAANSNIIFKSDGGTERLRIDASGALGLGTTPPSGLHTSWSQLFIGEKGSVISEKSNSGGLYGTWLTDNMYLKSSTGAFANITTDESSAYRQEGGIHQWFTHSSGSANAAITLSEKMRIDASGNLLVGTTDTNPSNNGAGGDAGIAFGGTGYIAAARSQETVALFNRMDNDGSIVIFRKNGSDVGSIFTGHGGSQVGIGTNTTGITFNPSTRSMMPANPSSTNPQLDATLDIGFPSVRWKDLYLSGGVYLGGTGAANKLDDYEEGTWTPAISGATHTVQQGSYTKVGDLVFFKLRIAWSAYNNAAGGVLTGLPFTADAAIESMGVSVYVNSGFGSIPSGKGYLNAFVASNNTTLNFTWQPNTAVAEFAGSGNIYVSGTYLT